MKDKKNKNTSNLVFSAFLVIAFVICAYFFSGIITTSTGMNDSIKTLLSALIFVVFGLFLFYATRVGDGKQVKRFSLATLLIMDIPALYIIIASVAQGLPFSAQIAECPTIIYLAAITLGYGIPYTFVSGYEIQPNEEETENSEENTPEADEIDSLDDTEISETEEQQADDVVDAVENSDETENTEPNDTDNNDINEEK